MLSSRLTRDQNPSTSSHLLAGNSAGRKTLTFFPVNNDTITISGSSPAVAGVGITLLPGMAPIYLDADFHGSIVQDEWYAIYTVGTNPMVYIEAMM